MAEKLDSKETVTIEELAISNSFEITAMFNILERKGIITQAEFLDEINSLRIEH